MGKVSKSSLSKYSKDRCIDLKLFSGVGFHHSSNSLNLKLIMNKYNKKINIKKQKGEQNSPFIISAT
jgi:hypothetical protein